MISTGTPAGVGLGHKPPLYLRPGDVVGYGVDGLGEARQRVIAAECRGGISNDPGAFDTCQRDGPVVRRLLRSQQSGGRVIVALLVALTLLAGSHVDRRPATVNNFLNSHTLIQTATDASFFAIMAVGATIVIISGGIDLSVGSVYALAGVAMALILRVPRPAAARHGAAGAAWSASRSGIAPGSLNGAMVVGLRVHPFIITLGTMWILRGIAFVGSKAESILLPESLTRVAKAPLGLGAALYPVPML